MDILQLSHYLDNLLDIKEIKDSPNAMNGLQVQNTGDIKKVGLAVDLCMATIEKAVAAECNMMFVHHGMLWGGVKPIRGNFYDKISTMICENIGLYSAHLPLDMHPVLGNNKVLADQLELNELEPFGEYEGQKIGFKGRLKSLSAEELGAKLVTVHGETIVEPVEPGTNEAAVRSAFVDVLAHPGLISYEVARLAAENGVYLEISARKGHSLANGHVVNMARQAGAATVLDSDAHEPDDLLTLDLIDKIAEGAGLNKEEAHALLKTNPQNLLAKLGFGPVPASDSRP